MLLEVFDLSNPDSRFKWMLSAVILAIGIAWWYRGIVYFTGLGRVMRLTGRSVSSNRWFSVPLADLIVMLWRKTGWLGIVGVYMLIAGIMYAYNLYLIPVPFRHWVGWTKPMPAISALMFWGTLLVLVWLTKRQPAKLVVGE